VYGQAVWCESARRCHVVVMLKRWMRRLPLQFQDLQLSKLLRDWIAVQLKEDEWTATRTKFLSDLDALAKVRSCAAPPCVSILITIGHEYEILRGAAGSDRAQALRDTRPSAPGGAGAADHPHHTETAESRAPSRAAHGALDATGCVFSCFPRLFTSDFAAKLVLSANLMLYVDNTNQLTHWMATQVVSKLNVKERALWIARLIATGSEMLAHGNCNGLMQVRVCG
jgi:hypothetical protein